LTVLLILSGWFRTESLRSFWTTAENKLLQRFISTNFSDRSMSSVRKCGITHGATFITQKILNWLIAAGLIQARRIRKERVYTLSRKISQQLGQIEFYERAHKIFGRARKFGPKPNCRLVKPRLGKSIFATSTPVFCKGLRVEPDQNPGRPV